LIHFSVKGNLHRKKRKEHWSKKMLSGANNML